MFEDSYIPYERKHNYVITHNSHNGTINRNNYINVFEDKLIYDIRDYNIQNYFILRDLFEEQRNHINYTNNLFEKHNIYTHNMNELFAIFKSIIEDKTHKLNERIENLLYYVYFTNFVIFVLFLIIMNLYYKFE